MSIVDTCSIMVDRVGGVERIVDIVDVSARDGTVVLVEVNIVYGKMKRVSMKGMEWMSMFLGTTGWTGGLTHEGNLNLNLNVNET